MFKPTAVHSLTPSLLTGGLENYVPFLDFKERAQQWKWIGDGRDSDPELAPLYHYWLQMEAAGESSNRDGQATPPPRFRTDYVVKPSTEQEKAIFREQEKRRFDNPHKAFTYRLHGYEAVVGPVKGVYQKDPPTTMKAREHNLLVSDRPNFITILTLGK